ncbi:MAG: chromosome segregation protein SMC [Clostridiales bacterium]|nr:chromosome segregation protein SMC [Clostridiales bacterium]
MKLKKLEIYGFKSFADRTEIIFNEGITGIVGPNGSGKSNIGDAVRWVLGEQSARVLRGAKMEDVIFNGTAKRKAASYCEVSLVFDNEDGALKSSFAEVMVTRRVYRSGDSEYYLNKTTCRLRDILELFRDTGIGREGYSLIGQGRIDEILSAKGEERRHVFEEAAGVMTFRVRKEEAERKLARTRENLDRVGDIIEELENRLGPLESQAEVAREYLELAARLKELEINIFLIRHDKVKDRIETLKQTVEGLQDVLLNHEAALRENSAQRELLEEAVARLDNELEDARQSHLNENEALHSIQSDCQRIRQQIENEKDQITQLEERRKESVLRKDELSRLGEMGDQQTQQESAALASAEKTLADEQQKLADAIVDADEKEKLLDEHKSAILEAVNRLSDVKNRQARQSAIAAQMKKRLEEVQESEKTLAEKEIQLQDALEYARNQASLVNQGLLDMKNEASRCEGQLQAMTNSMQREAEEAQQLNVKIQADMSRLRLMDEMSREMEGYSQSVRRALQFGQNDPGVYGVVARLLQVPKELETAIDMVLGGALQNIVTRDEESAKRLIDHLRNNRLGRATFLPMTSVRSRVLTNEERKLLSMPGCLGVASELVSFDPKFRGIMENLLGRTVVARDLNSGIAIMRAGRHAFRLVTLDGDVMHSGGSMTGGTANKTAVSLLGREREMKDMRENIRMEQQRLQELRKALESRQEQREELKRLRNEAVERVHQEEIAAAREQERVNNAYAELAANQDTLARTRAAIDQLSEGIAEIEEDLRLVLSQSQNETIDREAMDLKTEEYQKALFDAREKVDFLRERVQKAQMHYADLSYSLDTLRRDRMRRDEEVRKLTEQIDRMDGQISEKQENCLALERELASRQKDMQECEERVRYKHGKAEQLEAARREKSEMQRINARQSDELHASYDQDSQKLHRVELNLSKAESELKNMIDHIFNTYELTYGGAEELRSSEPFDLSAGEREAASLRSRIREMGTVNVASIEEFASTKERYDGLTAQRDDLLKAEEDLNNLITRLLSQMEKQFVAEFEKLDGFFRITFARLFGGGQAELRLTDPSDALNCGIEIIAQPPGKKLQLLSLLSGGERALTAIAILFAMLKLKPTPFCILDEIEAALDEANIGYFADYLAEYKQSTQFVVVTHRKGTMERCDALYGVAMQERGISGMVSVNLQDYE